MDVVHCTCSLVGEASPQWERVDGKLNIDTHARMWYIYVCVPYVHNPESARKILRTRLKRKEGNGHLGKLAMIR